MVYRFGVAEASVSEARCGYCGRRFDRPSFGCPPGVGGEDHAQGTLADRIVDAVEAELNDRRLGWDSLDDDTRDELRETLVGKVTRAMGDWLGAE